MRPSLLALLCTLLFTATTAPAEDAPPIHVTLGDITDSRTNGQFFAELKVELKLSGDALLDVYGVGKPVFTTARDDTGRMLIKEDKGDTLLWSLQTRQRKSPNETVNGVLANPARKAATVTLQGYVPAYAPTLDPASIVTLPSIAAVYGKTMESKETEISLTVLDKASYETYMKTKADKKADASGGLVGAVVGQVFGGSSGLRDHDVQFRVKDPHGHLVKFEVTTADGKAIENSGKSKTTDGDEDVYTYVFRQDIPGDAGLKIYYATPKSMLKVPFDLPDVALP